jgi:2-keto-4-pentenoate hydratase/2-oxohepta-3-ene-1,7-dioic acid hydratase in catechol pathway
MKLIGRAMVDGRSRYGEIADDRFRVLSGKHFGRLRPTGQSIPLSDMHLLSPAEPRKILIQMGGFMPKDGSALPPGSVPWLLPKLATSVNGQDGKVVIPAGIEKTWAEVEVAIVIGRRIQFAGQEEAANAIFGYTCSNEVSAPQFLAAHDYWRAKSIEGFACLGPWIRTDLTQHDFDAGLRIQVRVNGEVRGEGTTATLKYKMARMVSFASHTSALEPGDVISLGTPAPCEVVAGDIVECEVEGIGTLRNSFVAG